MNTKAPSAADIEKLKLHESIGWDGMVGFMVITRVPNGYIYATVDKSHKILSTVFVPRIMK